MIGVLGGTFDPIHYGHLRPAQEVMRALTLREVRIIPSATPPHRPPPAASAAHRLEMARLACVEFEGFVADDRECRRAGPSYTVDTLASLRSELGRETPLCLLLGVDAFQGLTSWREWERIPELAHLVVMRRPGAVFDVASLPGWARSRMAEAPGALARTPAGRLWFQPVTPQDVSATAIRAAIARGESAASQVPAAVWEYIRDNRLYIT